MTTLFVSDLHLHEQQAELTEHFIDFLHNQAQQAEALYILGDFFEIWIGDDAMQALHKSIVKLLKKLADQGIRIFLMHGNRDFLLGQQFAKAAGCQLIPDPYCINLYGTPTLLMHGDSLCAADQKYLAFRRFVRQPWLQRLFLALPIKLRQAIALHLRQASSSHMQQMDKQHMDSSLTAIIDVMHRYQVKLLIHGHTHQPSLHWFRSDTWLEHIVLSDWQKQQANVLVCYSDGRRLLSYF